MADDAAIARRTSGLSTLAVLATLTLIVGSIALGIFGPRMGQRGTRLAGEPLSDLRNEVEQLYQVAVSATRRDVDEDPEGAARQAVTEVFGPAMAIPDLTGEDCVLEGAMILSVAGHRAVWLRYRRSADRRWPVMVLLVAEPHDLLHFDPLGRYLPLAPGVRFEETLEGPGMRPSRAPGLVIHAQDGYAVVVVATPLDVAVEIENAILPAEPEIPSEIEVVAGILETGRSAGPM